MVHKSESKNIYVGVPMQHFIVELKMRIVEEIKSLPSP